MSTRRAERNSKKRIDPTIMTDKTGADIAKEAMQEVPHLTCAEYRAMREAGEPHVFLDVREKEEFDAGHLEGAINVPRGLIEFKVETTLPDKRAKIVICCAKGGRAALAGGTLMEMGYDDVAYLEGGYSGYCEEEEKGE